MTTDQAARDVEELATYLAMVAETWTKPMPAGAESQDPLPQRLRGAAHSTLVQLEGSGGVAPHKLSPKGRHDLDLLDEPLHEILDAGPWDRETVERREFLAAVHGLIRSRTADGFSAPTEWVIGQFVADLCRFIADCYELRPLECDEDGEVVGEGDDIAVLLPAAFAARCPGSNRNPKEEKR